MTLKFNPTTVKRSESAPDGFLKFLFSRVASSTIDATSKHPQINFTLSVLLKNVKFRLTTALLQPFEEPLSPPKFRTKSPKTPKSKSKGHEKSIADSLSELPFAKKESTKGKKPPERAFVQLEKMAFPKQVKTKTVPSARETLRSIKLLKYAGFFSSRNITGPRTVQEA